MGTQYQCLRENNNKIKLEEAMNFLVGQWVIDKESRDTLLFSLLLNLKIATITLK